MDLESMLRLAAGSSGLIAKTSGAKRTGEAVVCRFTVSEASKFGELKTAFDAMTRFQQRALQQRQERLSQILNDEIRIGEVVEETARRIGVRLTDTWREGVLPMLLQHLCVELGQFWP